MKQKLEDQLVIKSTPIKEEPTYTEFQDVMPIVEHDTQPDTDWGIITSNRFKVNKGKKRAFILDDFYEDPDAVREYAMEQYFTFDNKEHGGVGGRTRKQFVYDGVKETFERVMDAKITNWVETYGVSARFQVATAGTPSVFHVDSQQWAAMIYLTPDAPFSAGTKIVANKKTKIYHSSQTDNVLDFFPNQDTFTDPTLFEDVDVFGNVYNRCVIFDAQSIHTACDYFGGSPENGRLWQMFFFDVEFN